MTIRAASGGEKKELVYRFDLAEAGEHDFVPRLWATRRAGALLDEIRVEGESPLLVDQVRRHGLGYGIVTPYTTFVIKGQAGGAASAANMDLYGDAGLNEVAGRVTIQARVQNQQYQQAALADLASGANVTNHGQRSLAQIGFQQVDLSLLRDQWFAGPVTGAWLDRNIEPDRTIQFGSDEYLALAADPEIRPFLQSGTNVVFAYDGEVIAIEERGQPQPAGANPEASLASGQSTSLGSGRLEAARWRLIPFPAVELIRLLIQFAR